MASSVPACKQAILDLLNNRAALDGINISWAGPTRDEDFAANPGNEVEMIYLGRVRNRTEWAALGSGRRVEAYTVEIKVWVERWGDDPQTVETRAVAVWDEIEDALRDDIRAQPSTLRTAGVFTVGGAEYEITPGPASAEKWGTRIDATVAFEARNV